MDVEQQRFLDECSASLREQAILMKKAIEADSLRDVLKHGSNMLCELRTSSLSPKSYYQLYMLCFQELQYLQQFIQDKTRHGKKLSELYESVQHAGNIIPRTYLLITVGSAFIKSGECPSCVEVLRDMAELSKGIQDPMRGLFVRYYYLQICKDSVLPESAEEACEIILLNFLEMTKLWIRLAQQPGMSAAARHRRERERHDLRVVVGTNLVRLSQVEGMTRDYYSQTILPKLLEQITLTFLDQLAQQYLLDCIVQVFPDEYHVHTLNTFLGGCSRTLPSVDLRPVLITLMNRLRQYVINSSSGGEGGQGSMTTMRVLLPSDTFGIFRSHLEKIINRNSIVQGTVPVLSNTTTMENQSSVSTTLGYVGSSSELASATCLQALELLNAFLGFSVAAETGVEHESVEFSYRLSSVFQMFLSVLAKHIDTCDRDDVQKIFASDFIDEFAATPFSCSSRIISQVLAVQEYSSLMTLLPSQPVRVRVCTRILTAIVESNNIIESDESLQRLLSIISSILIAASPQEEENGHNRDDDSRLSSSLLLICRNLCKLVHCCKSSSSVEETFVMLCTLRNFIGSSKQTLLHKEVFPALVVSALSLVDLVASGSPLASTTPDSLSSKKLFHFIHKTCSQLVSLSPEVSLQLWLLAAQSACLSVETCLDAIAQEFLTQALLCFEDELTGDTRTQCRALSSICGGLVSVAGKLDREIYEGIALKTTHFSSRLLKKADQCRAVRDCSHLFWNEHVKDSKRLLECVQKCLKLAESCLQSQGPLAGAELFVEILDMYIYYFDLKNPSSQEVDTVVTPAFINKLLLLCWEHASFNSEETSENHHVKDSVIKHLRNVVDYIDKQRTDVMFKDRYSQISTFQVARNISSLLMVG